MSNPKKDWQKLGDNDPFFGVLSAEENKSESFDDAARSKFYDSGKAHIQTVLQIAKDQFGFVPQGRALDFGCGVGRLTLPLAAKFNETVGVDISDGMLKTARETADMQNVDNVVFQNSENSTGLPEAHFDFIHTYIVLQHMLKEEGEQVISQLIRCLKPGGVGAIHFTFDHIRGARFHKTREFVKRHSLARALGNLLTNKRWNRPVMLMSRYDLPSVFRLFGDNGIEKFYVHRVDDWGDFGLFVFFRKGSDTLSEFSNPIRSDAAQ